MPTKKKSYRRFSAITPSHQTKNAKTTVQVTGLDQLIYALGRLGQIRDIAWLVLHLSTGGTTTKPEEPPPGLHEPTILVISVMVAAEPTRVRCGATH